MFLYLLLAAGALYVVAKAVGESDGDARSKLIANRLWGGDRVEPGMSKLDLIGDGADVEKFMDPLFDVFGQYAPFEDIPSDVLAPSPGNRPPYTIYTHQVGNAPNAGGGPFRGTLRVAGNRVATTRIGYEYLANVPRNATARIAAIQAKVDAPPRTGSEWGPDTWRGKSLLEPIVEKSEIALVKYVNSLLTTYENIRRDADYVAKLAATYKVPVDTMVSEAKDVLALGGDQKKLLDDAAKRWGPVLQGATAAIMQTAEAFATGTETQQASAALALVGAAALAIPVVGPFVALATSYMQGLLAEKSKVYEAWCQEEKRTVWGYYTRALERGFVTPWHSSDMFSDACIDDTVAAKGFGPSEDQVILGNIFSYNLEFGMRLDAQVRRQMQKWWTVALVQMSDPRVLKVFEKLGFDAAGGVVASDEQVVLVAAPIAVAYGLDVYRLARALWDASPGYRGAVSSLRPMALTMDNKINTAACNVDPNTFYCGMPQNAWWVQWGVLAEAAFRIAEDMKTAGAPKITAAAPLSRISL